MPINKIKIQERAEKLARQGKIAAAIAEYQTLLKEQPNDLNTVNRVGDLLLRQGQNQDAAELFSRAANLYTLGGFFLKAIAIYKKILKIDPSAIDPRLKLADLYARRDFNTEARAEYIAVAEKLVRDGNETKAREVYEKLVRMEPGNVKARTALADIYLGRGDSSRAVSELRSAASELEKLGLTAESAVIHRRILESIGADMEVLMGSVQALARLGGDPEPAIEAARSLREKFPDETAPVEALVEALELGGQTEEAEELVKSALGDAAQGAVPRAILGRLHARAGRLERAAPLLLEASRNLLKDNRLREAAGALDTLLAVDPSHRGALEQRVEIARALGAAEDVAILSERVGSAFGDPAEGAVARDVAPSPGMIRPEPRTSAIVTDRPLTREEKDFLSEHLTEAEVFVKYGLLEKAIEPLQAVLGRFPSHLEAQVQLKTIYAERGNRGRVVDLCLSIAEIHEQTEKLQDAARLLGEARNLDPDNPVVRDRIERLGSMLGEPSAQERERGATGRPKEVEVRVEKLTGAAAAPDVAGAKNGSEAPPSTGEPAERSPEFFDLAGEFGKSLAEVLQAEGGPAPPEEESQDFGEIFKAFRQKIDQEIDSEDFRTHYDLAIAYKEMGLIDEAVAEFQYAARDPQRVVDCCAMLGLCFREKGMPALAEKWYLKGLQTEPANQSERLGLRFELAETYIEMGDYARARESFRLVAGVDGDYRDVSARLQEVERLG